MGKNAEREKRKIQTKSKIQTMLKTTPGSAMDLPCPCRSGRLFKDCHGSAARKTHSYRCAVERKARLDRRRRRADKKRERKTIGDALAPRRKDRKKMYPGTTIVRADTFARWSAKKRAINRVVVAK